MVARGAFDSASSFVARRFTLLAIAAVSGCGQGSPAAPTQSSVHAPVPLAWPAAHFYGNDWMYSSQPQGNEVVVYKRKKDRFTLTRYEMLASGFSNPMGMVTTPDGSWYIANSGASNVLVYRSTREGPKGPRATLSDDGEVPVNVDVTPDQRLVAVSNASTTRGGAGSVSVYLDRQHEPSHILTYGNDAIQGEGVAIDSKGNCYWSFNDPKRLTGSIVEFVSCNGSGTLLRSGILKAGGLAFDRSGNLYYVDQVLGIFKCRIPSSCSIFTPVALGGLVIPANINFDNSKPQNLWIADAAGYIDAVSLRGLITYTLSILGGAADPPIGIAPAPGS
jgi:DNA-binding beta-propeller fold protein YncE